MTVWLCNHYAITPEQSGGTRHFSLSQQLQRLGHSPVVIASNFDHFNGGHRHPGITAPKLEDVHGVPFLFLPTRAYTGNGRGRALNMVDFSRGLKNIGKVAGLPKPDVILGSSPHLFTPHAALKIARRLRVPFVLEVRDVWPQTLVDLGNFKQSSPLIRVLARMEKQLYRESDHVVSLLPRAADHCVNLGARRENTTWIPNGIDFSLADTSQQPARTDSDFLVMFAGAHGLANGLDTVLDTAKLVAGKGIRFRLLGDGPEKPRLVARATNENITNVEFRSPVAKREVYAELEQADAFVMLLKASEVFRWGVSPNKLFDYMACRRPVVFSVNSSNSPVEEAQCGIRIAPDDPEAMAKALISLRDRPAEERAEMGARGRIYVEENHSFDVLGERLANVLENVVEQHRAQRNERR